MIVVDASVVVDFVLGLPPHGERIADRLEAEAPGIISPHLVDAEVAQVVRRYVLLGDVTIAYAESVLDDLAALPMTRYPHGPLLRRAFELRDNATIYDALYVALAEATDAPLLTRDAALGRLPGHGATVEVIG